MKKCLYLALMLVVFALPTWAQAKKRVAVLDFDYSAVKSQASAMFGTDQDVGKGIADILVTQLVKDGALSVIERKAIDKIMNEQNFANSDRVDPETAAKIGRILGVDAMIVGSITQFGRDDKGMSTGGHGLGGLSGKFGVGGIGTRSAKAVVVINGRMIDTTTAEILAAASGKGQSKRSGVSLLGAGGSSDAEGGGHLSMGSSNFGDTILGEATNAAVADMAKQLDDAASRIPTKTVAISGLIADVSGNTLILNVGSKAGVKVGDKLGVFKKGREVRDPSTGKVLKTVMSRLGDVVITEVDEGSATGTYSGGAPPSVGDAVKNTD